MDPLVNQRRRKQVLRMNAVGRAVEHSSHQAEGGKLQVVSRGEEGWESGKHIGKRRERSKSSGLSSGYQVTKGETSRDASTVAADCEQSWTSFTLRFPAGRPSFRSARRPPLSSLPSPPAYPSRPTSLLQRRLQSTQRLRRWYPTVPSAPDH